MIFRYHNLLVVLVMLVLIPGVTASDLSLHDSITAPALKAKLLSAKAWHPFPTIHERKVWQSVEDSVRLLLTERGEAYLDYNFLSLPATLFLDFVRTGNRSRFQDVRKKRRAALSALVLAECMEGEGRFLDDIANGLWAICEETYWGLPAHLNMQKAGFGLPDVEEPTVDLFAAETSHLLCWTYYLLNYELDSVSPLLRERIEYEVRRRILKPCLERNDFWWMGFGPDPFVNNWNPWCHSNWLTSVLILETDEQKRFAAIDKILSGLDRFIASYPEDGGCDEGPGYWNRAAGSLFDCLELLHSATQGAIDVYDEPLIRNMGKYIYRAHIDGPYFINFADASAKINVPADLVFRYGKRIGDDAMMQFGSCFAHRRGDGVYEDRSIGRILYAVFNRQLFEPKSPNPPHVRDVWLPGNEVMAARSKAGTANGFYVAAQGGHNAESHNHNDVGNFIVYYDGLPFIIDVGVETYTAKTFSPQRYEIWTMQSAFHNLPSINHYMQKDGKRFRAREVNYVAGDKTARLQMDIASAWGADAGVESWKRDIHLDRKSQLQITDEYQLTKTESLVFNFLLAGEPDSTAPGKLEFTTPNHENRIRFLYDQNKAKAVIEPVGLTDRQLRNNWGDIIYRLQLIVTTVKASDKFQFIIKP
ncbi:heparinase [candidate division KSB1 bacterium]|nr:heparinase [candidate division KSB1 bacterium]